MIGIDRLRDALAVYGRPRLIAIFGFGMASGFPLTLTLSTLAYWLAREGVSKTDIGLFAALTTPYALKFVWAPLVDRLRIPLFGRLGARRGWLLSTQTLLVLSLLGLAAQDPRQALGTMAVFAFLVAFFSATQDIVIDAYRIELLDEAEQAAGAAMNTFGYRTANLLAGAGALLLADHLDWSVVYVLMALLVLPGTIAALLIGEPARHDAMVAAGDEDGKAARAFLAQRPGWPSWLATAGAWLHASVIVPFIEFLQRPSALLILLFVLIYKLGDAMGQLMMPPFLVDLGFDNSEIAFANKTVGFVALMAGTALGGSLTYAIGLFRALLVTGLFMMLTNLMFAALALVGHDVWFLALAVGLENFASGIGLVVFIAYLSGLCHLAFTATQYALLSSLASVARTWVGGPSGALAETVGWFDFYLLTTLAALPGLVLLWLLWRRGFTVRDAAQTTS
ncbi:MAG: MFS transporter [Rhodothalassiaceae bacterium]